MCISQCFSIKVFGFCWTSVYWKSGSKYTLRRCRWPRTMFSDYGQECIVSISPWDSLKIHFLSFACGFWVILKRLAQWAWNPNGFFSLQRREAPPPCLVDSSLGRHSYMKLKVNSGIFITCRLSLYKYGRQNANHKRRWCVNLNSVNGRSVTCGSIMIVNYVMKVMVHIVLFGKQGVKLHYVESGDRDKPLLLLLHGFPDCWLSWRYQIPVLAQHYR